MTFPMILFTFIFESCFPVKVPEIMVLMLEGNGHGGLRFREMDVCRSFFFQTCVTSCNYRTILVAAVDDEVMFFRRFFVIKNFLSLNQRREGMYFCRGINTISI